jgi:hypothetical protein
MKRIGLVLLSVSLAGLGCLPHSFLREEHKPAQTEIKEGPPPVVQPEGITEKNATDRARQLREELEYDEKNPPAVQPEPAKGTKTSTAKP